MRTEHVINVTLLEKIISKNEIAHEDLWIWYNKTTGCNVKTIMDSDLRELVASGSIVWDNNLIKYKHIQ